MCAEMGGSVETRPMRMHLTSNWRRANRIIVTGPRRDRETRPDLERRHLVQHIWYGDRRDWVKWGTVLHLVRRHRIPTVVQVAFLRRPLLTSDDGQWPIADEIWQHFRSLHQIRERGRRCQLDVAVFDTLFDHKRRDDYMRAVIRELEARLGPKLVLLDPDTGVAPARLGAEHVRVEEIHRVWQVMRSGDWLVLYQHQSRDSEWCSKAKKKFERACQHVPVHTFTSKVAPDVAFFAAART